MKSIFTPQYLLVGFIAATSWLASAQTGKTVKVVPAKPPVSINGEDLFRQYCAVCHGNSGKGDGPAADALKKHPADLTQITRKNNGKFPELAVQRFIRGDDVVAAHGTRDMPMWGPIFSEMTVGSEVHRARVYSLLKYVEQIQAK